MTLDEAKVLTDVDVPRLGDEARMTFGIYTGLVHPWVQGGDINVMDLLSGGDMMVQLDSIGTTPAEGVSQIEWLDELKLGHKRTDVQGGVFETGPITFPHFHDSEPSFSKLLDPLLGGFVDIMQSALVVT